MKQMVGGWRRFEGHFGGTMWNRVEVVNYKVQSLLWQITKVWKRTGTVAMCYQNHETMWQPSQYPKIPQRVFHVLRDSVSVWLTNASHFPPPWSGAGITAVCKQILYSILSKLLIGKRTFSVVPNIHIFRNTKKIMDN